MSDQVTVRAATPADAAAVAGLLAGGAMSHPEDPGDPEPYAAALADIAVTEGNDVLVAELRGVVVGTLQLLTFRHLQHQGGRCAEVESVHVDAEHRSAGIGAVLLAEAVARARAAGCYRVQLTSNKARVDAHRFYLRHGFEATHEGFKLLLEEG